MKYILILLLLPVIGLSQKKLFPGNDWLGHYSIVTINGKLYYGEISSMIELPIDTTKPRSERYADYPHFGKVDGVLAELDSIDAFVFFGGYIMQNGTWDATIFKDSVAVIKYPQFNVDVIPYRILIKDGVMIDTLHRIDLGYRLHGAIKSKENWRVYTYPPRP